MIAKNWPRSCQPGLAALISVPFFGNYNGEVGTERDGSQWFVNIQPVVRFTLNDDWCVTPANNPSRVSSQSGLFRACSGSSVRSARHDGRALFFAEARRSMGFLPWERGQIFPLPIRNR